MKAATFQYHDPQSVAEAVALLRQYGDEAKVIAGGQSLVPILAMRLARFEHLIDLGRIDELRGSQRTPSGVRVGAMTTQAAVGRDPDVRAVAPLFARATNLIGHFQIRNRGTVGGSLAHADPAAEYPAVAVVLDGEVELTGPAGTRRVPAGKFFVSTWTTSAEPDEVLVAVQLPAWTGRTGFAIEELARRHGDFAMAGAACAVQVSDGAITRAAVGLFGMGGTPLRAGEAEIALVGASHSDLDLTSIGRTAVYDLDPPSDIHVSGHHRKRMAARLVERALASAIQEARDG